MVRGNFFLVAALFVAIIALAHGQTTSNKKDSKAAKAAAAAVVKEEPPAEPLNDMAQENSVQIHFMDYKRAEFLEVLPKVKTAIADSLSKYCAEHASKCGVEGSVNFTENDIGFIGNSDKERFPEEGRFVIPRLFATLPSENAIAVGDDDKVGDNEDLKAVARPVLEEFLAEHSQDIGKEGGVAIAYVNDKLVYPPRDQLSNILIVSISCGITLILIIVNLICQRISSNRLKKQLFKRKPIYDDNDGNDDGEITALNKAVVSSKPPAKSAKQVTMAPNRPGSSQQQQHEYQLARSSDDHDERRSNSSQSSQRGRNNRSSRNQAAAAAAAATDSTGDRRGRSGSGNRSSRYQNEYRDEVDETLAVGGGGDKFPMPDRKPLLYTTSVNTTTDPYSNTLDINTRIRLTQV